MPDGEAWEALPVPPDGLTEHYRMVTSFQKKMARRSRRWSQIWGGLFGGSMAANLALALGIAYLAQDQKPIFVPLVIQSDGTWDSEASIRSLPASTEQAVVRAAIWKYVKDYESYSWADAQGRYNFISAVSTQDVRDAYEGWFLPTNKQSPQIVVGQKGQIDVEKISIVFPSQNVAIVRFRRRVEYYEHPPSMTTWTATVEFQMTNRLPQVVRDDGDPGGLVVTRYAHSEDTT